MNNYQCQNCTLRVQVAHVIDGMLCCPGCHGELVEVEYEQIDKGQEG